MCLRHAGSLLTYMKSYRKRRLRQMPSGQCMPRQWRGAHGGWAIAWHGQCCAVRDPREPPLLRPRGHAGSFCALERCPTMG